MWSRAATCDMHGQAPMPQPSAPASPASLGPVPALGSIIVAWIGINAAVILSATESRGLAPVDLVGVLLRDACGLLALGLCGGLALSSGRRLLRSGRAALGLGLVALFGLGLVVVRGGALGRAGELAGGPTCGPRVFAGIVGLVALAVVVAALAGGWLRARGAAWLGVVGGLGALLGNHFVLVGDFPSAHLYIALAGVALATGALAGAPWPSWTGLRRTGPGPRWRGLAALVAGVATVAWVTVEPKMSVLLHHLRFAGSVTAPYAVRGGAGSGDLEGGLPVAWAPWFRDRASLPAIDPGPPLLGERAPIVILWTIDSLRADVLLSGEYDDRLPNLAVLRDRSFSFTEARAPGSQTVVTFTSIFAGTYFSSQYWSKRAGIRDLWPDDEESGRFPELLTQAGVATINLAAARWLVGPVGVVRGFRDELFVRPRGHHFTLTSRLLPELRKRLRAGGEGPIFAFVHALDAHSSVRPRKGARDPWARYIDNLALVDEGVGSLLAMIEELGLAERTILIVSADHGEAFGEHGVTAHGRTLYDELVRVPLLIAVPGAAGGRIETPVSLMDLGPTILDVFGLPTPATHLGESLAPALRGEALALTRPILAEGRLKKSLLFPDARKLIVDDRHHTTELYDLRGDPEELENLVDRGAGEDVALRTAILREFFAIHRNPREGYQAPYRK